MASLAALIRKALSPAHKPAKKHHKRKARVYHHKTCTVTVMHHRRRKAHKARKVVHHRKMSKAARIRKMQAGLRRWRRRHGR